MAAAFRALPLALLALTASAEDRPARLRVPSGPRGLASGISGLDVQALIGAQEVADAAPEAIPQPVLLDPAALTKSCQNLANLTSAAESPMHQYTTSLLNWLYGTPYQPIVAAAALVVGLCLTWDGPAMWQALFTLAVSSVAAGIACFEAQAQGLGTFSVATLMGQAALTVAWALYCGFEGSQVLLGSIAGFAGAVGTGAWVRGLEAYVSGVALFWYCVGVLFGVLVFTTWRRPVLACLAPVLGGFLFATGAGSLMSRIGLAAPFLPKPDDPWAEAAAALLGVGGAGAFALYGAPVLLAATLNGLGEARRPMAVAVLVITIVLTALAHVVCKEGASCPEWLAAGEGWKWPLVGSAIWAAVAAYTAWLQLGMLEEETEANEFWRSYFWPLGSGRSRRSKRSMQETQEDRHH